MLYRVGVEQSIYMKIMISSSSSGRVVKAITSKSDSWLKLVMDNGREWRIPLRWLREIHPENFDPVTKQRILPCIQNSGKVLPIKINSCLSSCNVMEGGKTLVTKWLDKHDDDGDMIYSVDWLLKELERSRAITTSLSDDSVSNRRNEVVHSYNGQCLWSGLIDSDLRGNDMSMSYKDIVNGQSMEALGKLYKYGLLLVKDTPIDTSDNINKNAIIKFSEIVGYGPQTTLYGSVWSTKLDAYMEEGSSTADSAYSNIALPLHTDMTYYREPPGLQIFCMTKKSISGGESVFADGFAIGEKLRSKDLEAFQTLASMKRRYVSCDKDKGWHLEASGEIIQCQTNGAISCIRHNDLDRLPDLCVSSSSTDSLYDSLDSAHNKWDALINDDSNRLVIKLDQGEMVVIANQVSEFEW